MPLEPIVQKVVEAAGGVVALSDKLGITPAAFYSWRKIPQQHVIRVHEITGIELAELRPDLYQ